MNGNQVLEINLDDILPNRFQPRIKFHEKNINELAESIREHGVIQPIVVRKISDKYEIIAGERRFKASVLANKKTIPALVVNLNDQDAAEVALIENVQRQDLTPIEEAVSYKKILNMGMTQEQLATKLGKTQSTVANKLRLLNLDEAVQEALLEHKISERHARSLLKLPTNKDQVNILHKIVEERLTVRKTDQAIKEYMANLPNSSTNSNDDVPSSKESSKQSDVEVLDFMDSEEEPKTLKQEIKEEKEIDMNNNMNFNIPTTPIEGDQVDFNQSNINTQPISNSNVTPIPDFGLPIETPVTNPGFMDVNKIENQAQDIYQEHPKANVENLLTEDKKMAEIKPQETQEEELPQGKFFSFMPKSDSNPNFVGDLEKKETNMDFIPQEEEPKPQYNFDAFFNNNFVETPSVEPTSNMATPTPATETPMNNPTPVVETPTMVEQPTPVMPQPEPMTNINPVEPTVEVPSQPVQPTQPVEPTTPQFTFEDPVLEPVSSPSTVTPEPTISSIPTMEASGTNPFMSQPEPTPVQPMVEPIPSMEPTAPVIEPTTPMSNPTPVVETPMMNQQPQMEEPTVTPIMDTPVVETPQDLGFNMDFRNLTPESNTAAVETPTPVVEPQTMVEQPIPAMSQPEPMTTINSGSTTSMVNIGQAIEILRNASSQLKNLGFQVDVEEYDLENMYQMIFKINK